MEKKTLFLFDTVALIIGIVVGVGIFKTPSIVAANTGSAYEFMFLWIAGGAISLIGALCYAELATTYPHSGGDYHYIGRAFGKNPAFLFAWSRMTVIQAGSIAMLAFVFGDYITRVLPLGPHSTSIYAVSSILILTILNSIGIRQGKWTQNLLSTVKILGLLVIFFAGIISPHQSVPLLYPEQPRISIGLAMIFVLLTYGGWNEAAYISAELHDIKHSMVSSLVWSIGIITAIYLLLNLVFIKILGMTAMAQSETIASDVMNRIAGPSGAGLISAFIGISALGAMNATIITGARTNFALGREYLIFRYMGRWNENAGTPVIALLVQAVISLFLVLLGTVTRKGFVTIVEYTAPVFWLFFLLATLSLIVLRVKEPEIIRPFAVPLYPFTPLFFSAVCLFMFVSSIQYTGIGAFAGIAVLLAGVPFLAGSAYLNKRIPRSSASG